MFKSLVVLGSLFAGYVSGAPTLVSPVTVVYDKFVSDACAEIIKIKTAGANNVVVGWYNADVTPAAPAANTALVNWVAVTDKTCTAAIATTDISMGVKIATWTNTLAATLISASSAFASTNTFSSLYWDVEGLTACAQADVKFIADSLASATVASSMPIYLSVPAAYLSTDANSICVKGGATSPNLKGAIEAAVVDATVLAGIVVQYYNSGADFSTLDSMFITAPTAAAGSAMMELNSDVTKLKDKFIAGKLMKTSDNPDTTKPASDFTALADLDIIVCQAKNFDNYKNGLALYSYFTGDETLLTPALAQDCTGVTTSTTAAPASTSTTPTTPTTAAAVTTTTTKASGASGTLMISSVAVAAGLAVIMN